MKWYKHISDSLDDPFIFGLIHEHGSLGYLVFFGVLEIYSREYSVKETWKLSITKPFLKQKLQKSKWKRIGSILKAIHDAGKWEVIENGDNISIYIPKFRELLDEWTMRKMSMGESNKEKHSGVNRELLRKTSMIDKDTDKDKEKTTTHFASKSFDAWWSKYPHRNGKKVTKDESMSFLKGIKFKEWDLLLTATENYEKSEVVQRGFAKDPIRFLKKSYWKDWIDAEHTPAQEEDEEVKAIMEKTRKMKEKRDAR
jgi:hypothetical protein